MQSKSTQCQLPLWPEYGRYGGQWNESWICSVGSVALSRRWKCRPDEVLTRAPFICGDCRLVWSLAALHTSHFDRDGRGPNRTIVLCHGCHWRQVREEQYAKLEIERGC